MEGRTTTTASPSEEHLRAAPGSSNSGEQALPSAGEKRKCPPKGGPEEDDDDEEDEEDEEDDGNEPFPVEAVETPGGSRYGVRRVLVPDFHHKEFAKKLRDGFRGLREKRKELNHNFKGNTEGNSYVSRRPLLQVQRTRCAQFFLFCLSLAGGRTTLFKRGSC